MIKVALCGNPNCGKTTLFNNLTGSQAHVGNWPGVTVERKEGLYKRKKDFPEEIEIVDLPGIYSLSPYTPEEVISRNFLLDGNPDVVVNVVDATNLSRNLFLTSQVLEMDVPVVIALNLMDVIEKRGDTVDVDALSQKLGVPVLPISALKGSGMKELMKAVYSQKGKKRKGQLQLNDSKLKEIGESIAAIAEKNEISSSLFVASKLMENDKIVSDKYPDVAKQAQQIIKESGIADSKDSVEERIADDRYEFIDSVLYPLYHRNVLNPKISFSDRVDRILTNRWLGLPIFAIVMFLVFCIVFNSDFLFMGAMGLGPVRPFFEDPEPGMPSLGIFLQDFLDWFLNGLILENLSSAMTAAKVAPWFTSLLCDGILGSVFAVLTFLPLIVLLTLFIQLLENSGYMARVAFVFDRILRRFGISGKCVVPLISCFGCAVPGIMGARTIDSQRERVLTISLTPFFACGAKLPIFMGIGTNIIQVLTGGAIQGGIVAFIMYGIGILGAIIAGFFSNEFIIQGKSSPFIMEFPPYMIPQAKATGIALWEETKRFLKRAGTIIALMSALLWFLQTFQWNWTMVGEIEVPGLEEPVPDIGSSILASIGSFIQPLFYPLGFAHGSDGWKYIASAVTGLVAKEQVVGTMESLNIYTAETAGINLPGAFSFLIFNLFTLPCVAAMSAAKAELKSKKNFRFVLCFWIVTSYVLSLVCYGLGSFSLIGTGSYGTLEIVDGIIAIVFIAGLAVLFVVNYWFVRKKHHAIRLLPFVVEDKDARFVENAIDVSSAGVGECQSRKKGLKALFGRKQDGCCH